MEIATKKDNLRILLATKQVTPFPSRRFCTEIPALDAIAPNGEFQYGAVHELLWPRSAAIPTSFALILAKAARGECGTIAWNDPERELHLPALAAMGVNLRHLILLRCKNRTDQLWALAECLRCPGVNATVGTIPSLSKIEARRLQLAAERGGGVGVFMRPFAPDARNYYAAATRWLVQPAPGVQGEQRWRVELLHGHGGQVGKVLLLEINRETRSMRTPAPLADRPAASATSRATA